jgi:hypothetical protein
MIKTCNGDDICEYSFVVRYTVFICFLYARVEVAFQKKVDAQDEQNGPRVTKRYSKERITMQAREFTPTCIIIGKGSYEISGH